MHAIRKRAKAGASRLKQTRLATERFHIGGKAGEICVDSVRTSHQQCVHGSIRTNSRKYAYSAYLAQSPFDSISIMGSASCFLAHDEPKSRIQANLRQGRSVCDAILDGGILRHLGMSTLSFTGNVTG
jgi:hypothetical protein